MNESQSIKEQAVARQSTKTPVCSFKPTVNDHVVAAYTLRPRMKVFRNWEFPGQTSEFLSQYTFEAENLLCGSASTTYYSSVSQFADFLVGTRFSTRQVTERANQIRFIVGMENGIIFPNDKCKVLIFWKELKGIGDTHEPFDAI